MVFDIIVLILIVLFFISGFQKGFLYQLIKIFILIGAFLGARAMTPLVAPLFTSFGEMPVILQREIVFIVIFAIIYFLGALIIGSILKTFHEEHKTAGIIDKVLGGILGSLKIGLVIYILGCFYMIFYPVIASEKNGQQKIESKTLKIIEKNNILTGKNSWLFQNIISLIEIKKDQRKKDAFRQFEEYRVFKQLHPTFDEFFNENDIYIILKNKELIKILNSLELYNLLANFNKYYEEKSMEGSEDTGK